LELTVDEVARMRELQKKLLKLQQPRQQLTLMTTTLWTRTMQMKTRRRAMLLWTMKTTLVVKMESMRAMMDLRPCWS
jgi:hypothetical protein